MSPIKQVSKATVSNKKHKRFFMFDLSEKIDLVNQRISKFSSVSNIDEAQIAISNGDYSGAISTVEKFLFDRVILTLKVFSENDSGKSSDHQTHTNFLESSSKMFLILESCYQKINDLNKSYFLLLLLFGFQIEYLNRVLKDPSNSFNGENKRYLYKLLNDVSKTLHKLTRYSNNSSFNFFDNSKNEFIYDNDSFDSLKMVIDSLVVNTSFNIPGDKTSNNKLLIGFVSNQVINKFSQILLLMTSVIPLYNKNQLARYFQGKKVNTPTKSNTQIDPITIVHSADQNKVNPQDKSLPSQNSKNNLLKITNDLNSAINRDGSIDLDDKVGLQWELLISELVPPLWIKTVVVGWKFLGLFCESQILINSEHSLSNFMSFISNTHSLLSIFGLCKFGYFSFDSSNITDSMLKLENGQDLNKGGFCGFILNSTRRLILQNYAKLKMSLENKSNEVTFPCQLNHSKRASLMSRSSSSATEAESSEEVSDPKPNLLEELFSNFSQSIFCAYDITIDFEENQWWEPEKHIKPNGLTYFYCNSSSHIDDALKASGSVKDLLKVVLSDQNNKMETHTASVIYHLIYKYVHSALSLNKAGLLRTYKNILEPLFISFGMLQNEKSDSKEFLSLSEYPKMNEISELLSFFKDDKNFISLTSSNLANISRTLETKKLKLETLFSIIESFLENNYFDLVTKNVSLSMKRNFVDKRKLARGSNDATADYLDLVNGIGLVNIYEVDSSDTKNSLVLLSYKTIFLFNSLIQRELLKPRLKSGNPIKILSEYVYIIQLLFIHVSINPTSWASWYHLGKAFLERADILSGLTEDQVKSHLASSQTGETSKVIGDDNNTEHNSNYDEVNCFSSADNCLSSSLICFSQSMCLLSIEMPGLISEESIPIFNLYLNAKSPDSQNYNNCDPALINASIFDLLFYTGHVLYRMFSKPIFNPPFKKVSQVISLQPRPTFSNLEVKERIFTRNLSFLISGNTFKLLNRLFKVDEFKCAENDALSDWMCLYQLGKSLSKIGKPKEAIIQYLKSIYTTMGSLVEEAEKNKPVNIYSFGQNDNNPKFFNSFKDNSILPCLKILSTISKLVYLKELCLSQLNNENILKSIIEIYYNSVKAFEKSNTSENQLEHTSEPNKQNITRLNLSMFLHFSNILKIPLHTKKFERFHQNLVNFATHLNILVKEIDNFKKSNLSQLVNASTETTQSSPFTTDSNGVFQSSTLQKSANYPPINPLTMLKNLEGGIEISYKNNEKIRSSSKRKQDLDRLTDKFTKKPLLGKKLSSDSRKSEMENQRVSGYVQTTENIIQAQDSDKLDLNENFKFLILVYSELVACASIMVQLLGQVKKSINLFSPESREIELEFLDNSNFVASLIEDTTSSTTEKGLNKPTSSNTPAYLKKPAIFVLNNENLEILCYDMYCRLLDTFGCFEYLPLADSTIGLDKRAEAWVSYFNLQFNKEPDTFNDLVFNNNNSQLGPVSGSKSSHGSKPYFLDKYLAKISNTEPEIQKRAEDYSTVSKFDFIKNINNFIDSIYDEKLVESVLGVQKIEKVETKNLKNKPNHSRRSSTSSNPEPINID
ncbi:hypothetical protein AYI70_g3625 [Smittium culicis]|uniref:Uncharacterized protein n=1 Tax=Smittium culicis TaxID=133412 RepID=A0A1R1Y2W2_9FUNG|nr:hypothetical protein AYI70_g3625 [Smittium culicis]